MNNPLKKIPFELNYLKLPNVTAFNALLLNYLVFASNNNGYCYPSNIYLASLFNCTDSHISKSIKKLKKLGYVELKYFKGDITKTKRYIYLTTYFNDKLEEINKISLGLQSSTTLTTVKYHLDYSQEDIDHSQEDIDHSQEDIDHSQEDIDHSQENLDHSPSIKDKEKIIEKNNINNKENIIEKENIENGSTDKQLVEDSNKENNISISSKEDIIEKNNINKNTSTIKQVLEDSTTTSISNKEDSTSISNKENNTSISSKEDNTGLTLNERIKQLPIKQFNYYYFKLFSNILNTSNIGITHNYHLNRKKYNCENDLNNLLILLNSNKKIDKKYYNELLAINNSLTPSTREQILYSLE